MLFRSILWFQVRKIISEFTESAFGDSFVYTWKYKKSSNGRYSVYGYEPIEIRTKKSLSEMNNERVHTCGHEVPEDTIKLFIQLIIIINVNKKMGKKLLPLLEYLQWTENSQLHISTIEFIRQFARAYSCSPALPVALGGFMAN